MTSGRVDIFTGHIRAALPYRNAYLVSLEEGTPNLPAIALDAGGDRRFGHKGGAVYAPGTSVLVVVFRTRFEDSKNIAIPPLIIGSFAQFPLFVDTDFKPTVLTRDCGAVERVNRMSDILVENDALPLLNQDRSYGRPLDVVSGDRLLFTALGGTSLLSDFLARFGVSSDCRTTFHYGGLLESQTHQMNVDSETWLQQMVHRGQTGLLIDNFAYNISEGLGAWTGLPAFQHTPVEEDGEDVDPNRLDVFANDQSGFFRRVLLQGGAVEGTWDTVKTASTPFERYVRSSAAVFPGMFSEMRRMDGIYRLRAAQEVRLERTGIIVVPNQIAELPDTPTESSSSSSEMPSSVRSDLSLILFDKAVEEEEASVFFQGLRKDGNIWRFPTRDAINEELFPDGESSEYLPLLPDTQREYSVEDVTSLQSKEFEAYPGRKVRLFRNSSVFLMASDGGFILSDGYGGELRMERGTVTIASAGDIRISPGRDLIELTPGNRILKAGERIDITSTSDAVAIKAETNLHMLGGNSGEGATIIENRAAADMDITASQKLLKGEAVGGGVIIRSTKSGASILGSFFYAAGCNDETENESGLSPKATSCDFVLDSGRGSLLAMGNSCGLQFDQNVSLSIADISSGIYISRTDVVLASMSFIHLTGPFVFFDKVSQGRIEKPVLKESGVQSVSVRLPNQQPTVYINGSARVRSDIEVGGSLYVQEDVSVNGNVGRPQQRYSFKQADDQTQSIINTMSEQNLVFRSLLENMVTDGLMNSLSQRALSFVFPDCAKYRTVDFTLIGTRWQSLLEDAGEWRETSVSYKASEEELFPYPGTEIYASDRQVLTIPEQDGSVRELAFNKYPVNMSKGRGTT